MNAPAFSSPRRRSLFLPILGAILLLGLFFLASASLWVISSLRLSSTARVLRNGLFASTSAHWNKKIEVNAGWLTVKAAQEALRFAHLDRKARTALESLRAGQVGVYELANRRDGLDRAAFLSAADHVMAGRGWDRLVGVLRPEAMVAVYIQKNISSPHDLAVCFAVMEREHLVVGSARSNLKPLMDLASEEWEKHEHRPEQRPLPELSSILR